MMLFDEPLLRAYSWELVHCFHVKSAPTVSKMGAAHDRCLVKYTVSEGSESYHYMGVTIDARAMSSADVFRSQ
jgi:hypothetical protein